MRIRKLGRVVFVATLVMGVSAVWAGKKEDFQDAVNAGSNGGCRTIPTTYGDLRSNCDNLGPKMKEWCDGGRGPVGCTAQFKSRDLVSLVEKEKKKLDDLKDKKRGLEDKKSRASDDGEKSRIQSELDAVEKEIYEQGKSIEQAEKNVGDRKRLVSDAIYNLDQCINHRAAAMNTFGAAIDRIRNENETDEIRNLARTLLGYYQDSKPGHQKVLSNYETALSFCKDERL